MDKETIYIYALCEPDSDKIRYVGKSYDPQKRYCEHLSPSSLSRRSRKNNWIKWLRKHDLFPRMIILEVSTSENWEESERWWIQYLSRNGSELTNTDIGGRGGARGRIVREETRQKLRIANLGKKICLGRIVPEITRKKISNSLIGGRRSEETRHEMSLKRRKLGNDIVREIRCLARTKAFGIIGKTFGVSPMTAYDIYYAKRYSDVKNQDGTDYIVAERTPEQFITSLYIPRDNIIQIRQMIADGKNNSEIAQEIGVDRRAIAKIRAGQTYQWIK